MPTKVQFCVHLHSWTINYPKSCERLAYEIKYVLKGPVASKETLAGCHHDNHGTTFSMQMDELSYSQQLTICVFFLDTDLCSVF